MIGMGETQSENDFIHVDQLPQPRESMVFDLIRFHRLEWEKYDFIDVDQFRNASTTDEHSTH